MSTPVTDMLEGLKKDRVMFAMPGHKGRLDLTDITEIDGADNLLHPSGCIMESQKMAARLNSAAHAMYSTNGSSACTSAMIGYFGRGAKVIAARDFHISAKNAMELYGTRPVYVGLKDMCKPVRTEEIVQAIEEHPDAARRICHEPQLLRQVRRPDDTGGSVPQERNAVGGGRRAPGRIIRLARCCL